MGWWILRAAQPRSSTGCADFNLGPGRTPGFEERLCRSSKLCRVRSPFREEKSGLQRIGGWWAADKTAPSNSWKFSWRERSGLPRGSLSKAIICSPARGSDPVRRARLGSPSRNKTFHHRGTRRKSSRPTIGDMPVSPARAAAFDILLRVERESSYAAELLHSAAYESLSSPDHALTTELVMGVLRWRSRLDWEIASASAQAFAKLDLAVVITLRLGLYQLRWLSRVPPRAALHESVELVKRARKSSAAGFVNAVLRKLSTRGAAEDTTGTQSAQGLAARFAHPEWLLERWSLEYGISTAEKICQYGQNVPTTAIRIR